MNRSWIRDPVVSILLFDILLTLKPYDSSNAAHSIEFHLFRHLHEICQPVSHLLSPLLRISFDIKQFLSLLCCYVVMLRLLQLVASVRRVLLFSPFMPILFGEVFPSRFCLSFSDFFYSFFVYPTKYRMLNK